MKKTRDGKEIVFHYKDNRRDGLHEIYYPVKDSKIKALEVNFVNDKPEGESVEYNEDGHKIAVTPYINGLKEGEAQIFSFPKASS